MGLPTEREQIATQIGRLAYRAYISHQLLAALAKPGMLKVLVSLGSASGPRTIRQLASGSRVSYSGTHAIVRALEKAGIVECERGKNSVAVRLRQRLPGWVVPQAASSVERPRVVLKGASFMQAYGFDGVLDFQVLHPGQRATRGLGRPVRVRRLAERTHKGRFLLTDTVMFLLISQGASAARFLQHLQSRGEWGPHQSQTLRRILHGEGLYGRARYFGLAKMIQMRPRKGARSRPRRDARRPQEVVE